MSRLKRSPKEGKTEQCLGFKKKERERERLRDHKLNALML